MYVCLCAGVTDTEIRTAVASGCCTIDALREEAGVGSGCGKCIIMAQDVVQTTLAHMARPPCDVVG